MYILVTKLLLHLIVILAHLQIIFVQYLPLIACAGQIYTGKPTINSDLEMQENETEISIFDIDIEQLHGLSNLTIVVGQEA